MNTKAAHKEELKKKSNLKSRKDFEKGMCGDVLFTLDRVGRKILGNYLTNHLSQLIYWLAFKPNPVIQILYGIIAGGGYYVYVSVAYLKYIPGPYIAGWHRWVAMVIMIACYFSFYKACTVDPGIIKDKKQAKSAAKMYQYDNIMYIEKTIC